MNILTPPDAMPASVVVQVTNNGVASTPFTVTAQPLSPSFFAFNGGPYVIATHADGSLLGPPRLSPGQTTPAKPGETVVLYANGFGPASVPVVRGSGAQSGALSPLPAVSVGGAAATLQFAGLQSAGLFQFNVVIPAGAPSGDLPLVATCNGAEASPVGLITIQDSDPRPCRSRGTSRRTATISGAGVWRRPMPTRRTDRWRVSIARAPWCSQSIKWA